jgi:aminoglycoside phosphotransferase (APT) family kinase protein
MPDIFPYNKSIDKKIKIAVAKVLNTKVLSAHKIKSGEINHVYKISTSKGFFVARVFRYHDWPENGKLEWIEKQLSKLKVPHAKMVYYSKSKTFFPNGFMISEFIPGIDGTKAVKKKIISEYELYYKFGELSSKIHKIKVKKFGLINSGKGTRKNYIDAQLIRAKKILNSLTKKKAFETNPYSEVKKVVIDTLKAYERKIQPRLFHGDMSETNTIVTKNKNIILIDWDNAQSGFWLSDFIELSRRQMFEKSWNTNPKRMQAARKAFFKGYGKIPFSSSEILVLENTLQMLRQLWQMNYYYFDNVNLKRFKETKRIFLALLKNKY